MDFLVFGAIICLILTFLCKVNFQDENTLYFKIVDKCKFSRMILPTEEIKRIYEKSRKTFLSTTKNYITHRFFKNLEFTVVEIILLNLLLIRRTNDNFLILSLKEKNHRLITKYLSVFDEEDLTIIQESLMGRFLMNLYSLKIDIFDVYTDLNAFLKVEMKSEISHDFVLYSKKNNWNPTIHFDRVYLQFLDLEIMNT